MSALDQILTVGVVKIEHPNLHKQAAAELAAIRAERDALKAERDEAVFTSNKYRDRVIEFCDALIKESDMTAKLEEGHGLEPDNRYEYQRAVEKIKEVFLKHNYLKEAELAGSVVEIAAALKGDA